MVETIAILRWKVIVIWTNDYKARGFAYVVRNQPVGLFCFLHELNPLSFYEI